MVKRKIVKAKGLAEDYRKLISGIYKTYYEQGKQDALINVQNREGVPRALRYAYEHGWMEGHSIYLRKLGMSKADVEAMTLGKAKLTRQYKL